MKILTPLAPFVLCLSACATPAGQGAPPAPFADYHQHLVSERFAPIVKFLEADGRALIARLDAAGIRKAVVLSMGYSLSDERKGLPDPAGLTRAENDWTSRQAVESHGRLIAFCSVNPLRDDALAEEDRCLRLPGVRGLKLHFGNSGVSLRNPDHVARLRAVFALAEQRRAAILVHMRARGGTDYGAPDAQLFLDQLVPAAPRTEIVVAHFGGAGPGYPDQSDAVMGVFAEAAERGDPHTRNLYFDVATILTSDASAADRALIVKRMRQVGMRRVLFGTDLGKPGGPSLSEEWALYATTLGLTPKEVRTIATNRTRFVR